MTVQGQHGTRLTCRVPASLSAKLDEFSGLTGKSRSDVVRWLIRKARWEDFPRAWLEAAAEEQALLDRAESH